MFIDVIWLLSAWVNFHKQSGWVVGGEGVTKLVKFRQMGWEIQADGVGNLGILGLTWKNNQKLLGQVQYKSSKIWGNFEINNC